MCGVYVYVCIFACMCASVCGGQRLIWGALGHPPSNIEAGALIKAQSLHIWLV